MLNIERFTFNMLQENCYVVSDETREAVIIDCGAYYSDEVERIKQYITQNQLIPVHLLCTHGHFDHCIGNNALYTEYGLKPELSEADEWLMDLSRQMQTMIGVSCQLPTVPVGKFLSHGDTIHFGQHTLKVLATPGHTPGSLCYYCEAEKQLFSGDTLFHMSVGRTDFERGSYDDLTRSLGNLLTTLPLQTKVHCGHGPETTLAEEQKHNPYLNL